MLYQHRYQTCVSQRLRVYGPPPADNPTHQDLQHTGVHLTTIMQPSSHCGGKRRRRTEHAALVPGLRREPSWVVQSRRAAKERGDGQRQGTQSERRPTPHVGRTGLLSTSTAAAHVGHRSNSAAAGAARYAAELLEVNPNAALGNPGMFSNDPCFVVRLWLVCDRDKPTIETYAPPSNHTYQSNTFNRHSHSKKSKSRNRARSETRRRSGNWFRFAS